MPWLEWLGNHQLYRHRRTQVHDVDGYEHAHIQLFGDLVDHYMILRSVQCTVQYVESKMPSWNVTVHNGIVLSPYTWYCTGVQPEHLNIPTPTKECCCNTGVFQGRSRVSERVRLAEEYVVRTAYMKREQTTRGTYVVIE